MDAKKYKRRANILYHLRKKNIRYNARKRTVFYPFGQNPYDIPQIRQLLTEFNFTIQLEFNFND